jgi:hypothetical protein
MAMHRRDVIGATFSLAAAGWTQAVVRERISISAAAWLAGRWTGEGMGGVAEEMWSPPADGAMAGHFQLVRDGRIVFYELMQIIEDGDGLVFRVRHVNRDFTAWEDKTQMVTFPFVSADATALRFRGLVLERTGDNAMTVTVTIRQRDGRVEDMPFRFVRA